MKKGSFYIIGQMSGTSLDGVDLAYVEIGFDKKYWARILKAVTIPYSGRWRNKLSEAYHLGQSELKTVDREYGHLLGEIISEFIESNRIEKVDFIASHGHTVFHKPEQGITLQIGNGPEVTTETGIKSICDFRVQDVDLGGQGAPLVPVGDRLLFSEYTYCLNLGGFANISFEQNDSRVAYDICPVNIVLNQFAGQLGRPYDDKGEIAASGKLNQPLLKALNAIPYYSQNPPKSLGFEFVEALFMPIVKAYDLSLPDLLRTCVEHMAQQIAELLSLTDATCLITGGGAYNSFLISRIQSYTPTKLVIPESGIVNYKEALIFAFLGYLKNLNKNNCLKSVTGAVKDHSSGVVYIP